jgi:uncharacterized protein (DUF433 family)
MADPQKTKFTISETAFVLDRSRSTINKAIERGEIDVEMQAAPEQGGGRVIFQVKATSTAKRVFRVLGQPELRYLMLIHTGLHRDLNPSGRKRIYHAIKRTPATTHYVAWHGADLRLDSVDEALKARLSRLDELRAGVEGAGRAEPVLRGTDVPVYAIAALLKGQTAEQVLEDYPGLTAAQLKIAADYATAYPKTGRPYPERSFKRMLGALAESGAFDDDDTDGQVTIDDFR